MIKTAERKKSFEGVSLEPVERLYTEADTENIEEIGFPGEFPYKRGIHPTGYRGKLWTMRQFAGFSSPEKTNRRFKYLMAQGQTGLSVAYDLPALMGLDADSPLTEGEVGKCGVAVSSLADFEVLFDGIPLDQSDRFADDQRSGADLSCDVSRRRGKTEGGFQQRSPARCRTTF